MNIPRMFLSRVFIDGKSRDDIGVVTNYRADDLSSFMQTWGNATYLPMSKEHTYGFELYYLDDNTTHTVSWETFSTIQDSVLVVSVDTFHVIPERFARLFNYYLDISFLDSEYVIKYITFVNDVMSGCDWSYELAGTHVILKSERSVMIVKCAVLDDLERELLKLKIMG